MTPLPEHAFPFPQLFPDHSQIPQLYRDFQVYEGVATLQTLKPDAKHTSRRVLMILIYNANDGPTENAQHLNHVIVQHKPSKHSGINYSPLHQSLVRSNVTLI